MSGFADGIQNYIDALARNEPGYTFVGLVTALQAARHGDISALGNLNTCGIADVAAVITALISKLVREGPGATFTKLRYVPAGHSYPRRPARWVVS